MWWFVVVGCAMAEKLAPPVVGFELPNRPKDPKGKPVVVPQNFGNWLDVMSFFRLHDAVLTHPQVEELARIHDVLKAREEREPRTLTRPQNAPESALTAAWRTACEVTEDPGERLGKLAEAACNLLGAAGGMQLHRVLKLYESHGVRPVNRAVIELAKEPLEPGQRFKFLEHRATLQKGKAV